ncbi:MAG: translation initiation factor IF-6 [Candidatus Hydrothermarchaeota archaeon]
MIVRGNLDGNPNIGVFALATDNFVLIPSNLTKSSERYIREAFNMRPLRITVGGSPLVGCLSAGNSKGLLFPWYVSEIEVDRIVSEIVDNYGIEIGIIRDRFTALGNLLLANDHASLVHPDLSNESINIIEDVLDVEVQRGMIAGMKNVGAVGIVTNKGGLLHPNTKEEEIEYLETLFRVSIDTGTVNHGFPYVKTGMIANSKGVLAGSATTGPEIARIENALGFLD